MEKQKLEFKEYKKGIRDKSSVWNYFLRTSDGVYAQCKKCKKNIKCTNTTTCLHNHLKLHPMDSSSDADQFQTASTSLAQRSLTRPTRLEKVNEDEPNKKKPKLINDYFKNSEDDMETTVSKMTACDGLAFSIFTTSDSIRRLFKKSGYDDLPKSPNTIKKIVVQKSEQIKNNLKTELNELKAKGQKFAISLDEWTSARNRRYMNVNVHCPSFEGKSFRNLGLARITGKGTADRCVNVLQTKLARFDLSLEDDIACIVTDGASVMCAMGRSCSTFHQLCFAHGIQCAVLDVIYKKNQEECQRNEDELTGNTEDEDDVSDSEEEEGRFIVEPIFSTNQPAFSDVNLKNVIDKLRKVVKFFKKSPTRLEILNNYLPENQKKMGLILDCKTRWSSLADMVSRFLTLKDPIKKALIDLKNDIAFESSELSLLQELSSSLNIVKATVEALCEENANLLIAETALQFMVVKLQENNNYISNRLLEALKIRIAQRRLSDLVCTLKYLHNPNKFYKETSTDFFPFSGNHIITKLIVDINKRYFSTKEDSEDEEDDVPLIDLQRQQQSEAVVEPEKSFKEQLLKQIDSTISASATSSTSITDIEELEPAIRMQMALFDRGGPRQIYLSQAYKFLSCIPPTSVECERVFSSSKYICNHLRCALNDDSLDALSFLRSYYQGRH